MRSCVHIVKSAGPECTGICRIVQDLARLTRPFGYVTSVLFLADGPFMTTMRDAGIRASAISWTGHLNDVGGAWQFWRWLRKSPTEIAHFHHGGRAARSLARLAGARAVVRHVHGRGMESGNEGQVPAVEIRDADAVIACSEAVANSITGCRPEVIYTGVAMDDEPPPAPAATGPLKIGVLGRLIPLKKVDSVIEAAAALSARGINVHVEIAGTGPAEDELRVLATKLGADERVRFLGWRADVRQLLASWDVLVMPSREEGFGLSALEAMAAARPVIASRVGGLSELVVDHLTGRLVPPGDVDALVRCIEELAGDRKRLVVMGVEGWKRARAHFSVDPMAQSVAELYDRLLDRSA